MIYGLMAAMQVKIESQDRQLVEALAREVRLTDKLAKAEAAISGMEQMLAGQRIELAQARSVLGGNQ